jgi:23S rRNA (cytidine2498-2'-O)-methyltransferase
LKPPNLLAYCRAGFERECAQELTAIGMDLGVSGFVKARPDSGFALFTPHDAELGLELGKRFEYRRLVFPRQVVRVGELLQPLAAGDRVTPIVAAIRALGRRFGALWIEMPDTNEGKALSSLARSLRPHLEKALAKDGVEVDASAPQRAHVFFVGTAAAHVGVSQIANSSPWVMGIPRLRMPSAAPSRSTLKLAEALMEFIPAPEQSNRLAPGMTAVDLGASPGGWTWQLVQRGFTVIAVDNGEMDSRLLDTGQVKHRREDGLRFQPPQPVDWMVCDMVETPSRIAKVAARWIAQGWCRESIFNLKLPMKKRWEEVERCRAIIDEELGGSHYFLRMKQLYHDREEITAHLARR